VSLDSLLSQTNPPVTSPTESFRIEAFDRHVMGTYNRFPLALERGSGCWLWDTEGREYLDFVAGVATCALGHSHPAMVAAVSRGIQKLQHVSNLYYIPEQGALAQWLVQHSCGDRAFFCNSGAEANEGAIKLARKYAHTVLDLDKPVILTAQAGFHGRTLATITATGQPKYQKHFQPLVPGFHYVPYNDLQALEDAIANVNEGEQQVAAILLEPLQGEGGVNPGDPAYFQAIRQICDDTGILLILDEVQTCMGRTGRYWGYEHLGIEPDVITAAKGLGGGIPIGALLCKEFCDVFSPGDHGSTFGGNPFACGVALAVAQTLEQENLLPQVQERGEQLRTGLGAIAQCYPRWITAVRGWGLINGLELRSDVDLEALDLVKAAMAAGLLLVPAGPKVVRFVPPLIVNEGEVNQALRRLDQALATLTQD